LLGIFNTIKLIGYWDIGRSKYAG